MQNIKPVLKVTEGKPLIRSIALRNIDKDEELLYDYSDNSKLAKTNFPWLENYKKISNKTNKKININVNKAMIKTN